HLETRVREGTLEGDAVHDARIGARSATHLLDANEVKVRVADDVPFRILRCDSEDRADGHLREELTMMGDELRVERGACTPEEHPTPVLEVDRDSKLREASLSNVARLAESANNKLRVDAILD